MELIRIRTTLLHVVHHHATTLSPYSLLGCMILSKHKGNVFGSYGSHRAAFVHFTGGLVRDRSSSHHMVLIHVQLIKRAINIALLQVL